MWSRYAFAFSGLAAAMLLLRPDAGIAAERPNILVIVSDDQGYADTGFQGCKDIPTPNLDRLAREGLRCTSGYASHPYCSPTRAGLMTGRYQARFGHEHNPHYDPDNHLEGLPLSEKLLPEFMGEAGYATGWIGKWHLGAAPEFRPEHRGFKETFGFIGGGHHFINWKPNVAAEYNVPIERNGKAEDVTEHLTLAFGHEAAGFVTRHKSEPWFLYLAFNAPHSPNQPTPERMAQFASITNKLRRSYAAQVSLMDDAIGEAMEAVRATGQAERTLVFFFSDNGGQTENGACNTPLRGKKGDVTEGGIRVPYVVSWPGRIPAAKDYEQPVSSLDVFATALACAGVAMPTNRPYDSVDLLPFLTGQKTTAPHDLMFWRRNESMAAALRAGDQKLIRIDAQPDQLFDLRSDILETNNLAVAHAAETTNLAGQLDAWIGQMAPRLAFPGDNGHERVWRQSRASGAATTNAPRPTAPQLAWQGAEFGVMFHYDPRIFNGGGNSLQAACKSPLKDPDAYANRFNPARLDADQWVMTAKAMGASFAILVVKHETGFCLWQSDANPFSLKNVAWRDGKADILRDFVASCRKHGLKPGIFTEARWDLRLGVHNFKVTEHSPVTQAQYNSLVEREVEELCTRYGNLFEIWFDGGVRTPAQGGPDVLPIVEKSQPSMLFYHSDQRRDARWGGTESGTVGYPCWATVDLDQIRTGSSLSDYLAHGDAAGSDWSPAMADVPLRCENGRHDWIWVPGGEKGVASLAHLQRIYCESVGRNSTLIVGLTPDRDGLMPAPDVARCQEFGKWLRSTFTIAPLAETSGTGKELQIQLPVGEQAPVTYVVIQEDIRQGERVREYVVEAQVDGQWQEICRGSCIGQKRIERIPASSARAFRLRITKSVGEPQIRSFRVLR